MNGGTLKFEDILRMAKRHAVMAVFIVILTTAAAIAIAMLIPKKYACVAVLNIQSAYFEIPLVGDVVTNSNDPSEFKAQRETLLRYALSNDFLDQLGEKYHLFGVPLTDRMHPVERDGLLARIEYFSIGSNNYQITARAAHAEEAYNIAKAVVDQMISTMVAARLDKLNRTKIAIEANLASLKADMVAHGEDRKDSLMDLPESLEQAEEKLRILTARFTPSHPEVIKQEKKVERLRAEERAKKPKEERPGGLQASHRTLEEIYDDLLRKFNLLNIVIDMEKSTDKYPYLSVLVPPEVPSSPLFPKKPLFAIAGFVFGLVFAFMYIVFREIRRGTFVSPVVASKVLDAPFLGSLPNWKEIAHTTKSLPAPPPGPEPQE
jgi:uncharacterized protein involved in exopolysaccharide biosynthesis